MTIGMPCRCRNGQIVEHALILGPDVAMVRGGQPVPCPVGCKLVYNVDKVVGFGGQKGTARLSGDQGGRDIDGEKVVADRPEELDVGKQEGGVEDHRRDIACALAFAVDVLESRSE